MVAKASPLSVRLPRGLVERLERSARRKGLSKSGLVARYLEEALRMEAHPAVTFRDGPAGRRPALRGGPDLWEVMSTLQVNRGSVAEAARHLALPERDIRAALDYYGDHPAEIDDWIRTNEEEAERGRLAWERQRAIARE